jgi:hypothetical protein
MTHGWCRASFILPGFERRTGAMPKRIAAWGIDEARIAGAGAEAGVVLVTMELGRRLCLAASGLGHGGLPRSSPAYGSRPVLRVDFNEG